MNFNIEKEKIMKHTTSKILGLAAGLIKGRTNTWVVSLLVAAFLLLGLANSPLAQQAPQRQAPPSQAAPRLRDVRRISVAEFGRTEIAKQVQERVIAGIIQSGKLQVVNASANPDAMLYGSVNSTRELTAKVVLHSKGNPELWARQVQAASNSGNQADAAASVAGRIVKQLLRSIEEDRNAR
jgi:hypothetical protein